MFKRQKIAAWLATALVAAIIPLAGRAQPAAQLGAAGIGARLEVVERRAKDNAATLAGLSGRVSRMEALLRTTSGRAVAAEQAAVGAQDSLDTSLADLVARMTALERITLEGTSAATTSGGAADPDDPDAAFAAALALLNVNQPAARDAMTRFIDSFPSHAKVSAAWRWIGETWRGQGELRDAADAYLKAWRAQENGPEAADSLLKLGVSLAGLGQNPEACDAFDEALRRWPGAQDNLRRRLALERRSARCS